MQFSQILQGRFRGIHDLTFFENSLSVPEFSISLGRMFHIVGPKYRNAFKPKFTDFTCGSEKSVHERWLYPTLFLL